MTTQPSSESSLFRAYWDDGVLDLLFGLAVTVAGIGWETSLGAFAVLLAPLWIVLWSPLRRKIVEPRAGYVQFSRARQQRNSRSLVLTIVLGLGFLVLASLAAYLARTRGTTLAASFLVPGLPGVLVALGASVAAVLTGARRFHAYAAALAFAAALTVLLEQGPALALAVGGAAVVVSAAILLTRFIRASRAYLEHA